MMWNGLLFFVPSEPSLCRLLLFFQLEASVVMVFHNEHMPTLPRTQMPDTSWRLLSVFLSLGPASSYPWLWHALTILQRFWKKSDHLQKSTKTNCHAHKTIRWNTRICNAYIYIYIAISIVLKRPLKTTVVQASLSTLRAELVTSAAFGGGPTARTCIGFKTSLFYMRRLNQAYKLQGSFCMRDRERTANMRNCLHKCYLQLRWSFVSAAGESLRPGIRQSRPGTAG